MNEQRLLTAEEVGEWLRYASRIEHDYWKKGYLITDAGWLEIIREYLRKQEQ